MGGMGVGFDFKNNTSPTPGTENINPSTTEGGLVIYENNGT
jgi:hypothetical protein